MRCPKCEGSLKSLQVDGTEVDRCDACSGIWFDKRELVDVLPGAAAANLETGQDTEGHDQKRGKCPKDGTRLMRVNSARNHTVTLDTCRVCQGIWLDAGEFETLREASPTTPFIDLI
ncbi:MAG: zf-TFIIB domain-containing protein [Planctomycetes bacterium]|nr:zf-TFIIB domain-containing protein [Planctomycetota bacterium]